MTQAERGAVTKSQVLLKDRGGVLPLRDEGRIYVAGSNADDIGNQAGGWTVQWQGQSGDIGGPLWQDNGVPRPPKDMLLSAADRAAVGRVCGTIDDCVVLVVADRLQTWPRSLAQEPINVGDRDYHPLYPYGWGLRTHARR
jgi:beta-glucosidase